MSPRRYAMETRAKTAEDTRRRIVEATYALHAERGIADTTMKDIAERADVGLGTVYHHFPTYDDAVRACGAIPSPCPRLRTRRSSPGQIPRSAVIRAR